MKKIYQLLDSNYKKKAFALFLLMLIGIFLELLGLGLILPLLTILASDDIGKQYPQIQPFLHFLGNPSKDKIVIYSLVTLVVTYIIKGLFLVYLVWRQSNFAYSLSHSLATRLHRKYMYQPYAFHLKKNSAELIQNLTNEISQLTGATNNLLLLLTEITAIIGILVLLFAVEPIGATSVMVLFGLLAFIFHRLTKAHLLKWGKLRQLHDTVRIETLMQSFNGIKDISLLGKVSFFTSKYEKSNFASATLNTKFTALQHIPRLWFEVIGVLGLVLIIIISVLDGKSLDVILPTLAVFVAAAFRIIPSLNRIVASFQTIKYAQPSIEVLEKELSMDEEQVSESIIPNHFERDIKLSKIKFNYEGTEKAFLDIDLVIKKGEMVGFIGASGAGKSTIIDLILGLLKPTSGQILVDDKNIEDNVRSWQNQIGYVPQTIYFLDDSLRNNIAFGVDPELISEVAIENAIKLAQLEDFIKDLPDGLDTIIGENGTRISGGQRQRIGIARALYNNPSVLVLDEATSALDGATEDAIMDSILKLHGERTIIIIAHRLRTVSECDYLYKLKSGKVEVEGTFQNVTI